MKDNISNGRNYIELKREGKETFNKLTDLLSRGKIKSYHIGDSLNHGDKGFFVNSNIFYLLTIRRISGNSYIPNWAIWKTL